MDTRLAKLFAPAPARMAAAPAPLTATSVAPALRVASSSPLQQVFARLAQPQKFSPSA